MGLKKYKSKICGHLRANLWDSPKIKMSSKKKWSFLNTRKGSSKNKAFFFIGDSKKAHLQYNSSLFSSRLKSKQKIKKIYYMNEKRFSRIFRKGFLQKNVLNRLESRLDTILFRMHFAKTPFAARQQINHGFFCINGLRMNKKGWMLQPGDFISPSFFQNITNLFVLHSRIYHTPPPSYLYGDYSLFIIFFLYHPSPREIVYSIPISMQLIKECYPKY